jgi:hypothetical protein
MQRAWSAREHLHSPCRAHLSEGSYDAAALVDEQLQRVKADEFRRRVLHLEGEHVARLLQSETSHQHEFVHLSAEWDMRTNHFHEEAQQKRQELKHKQDHEVQALVHVCIDLALGKWIVHAHAAAFARTLRQEQNGNASWECRVRRQGHRLQLVGTLDECCSLKTNTAG